MPFPATEPINQGAYQEPMDLSFATYEIIRSREDKGTTPRRHRGRKSSRYIKTVDRGVFEGPAPLELEYMATLHLKLAAAEQGFI